jgi:UDPglucose--hexose-1-phosphate uridylyltransferase
MLETPHRRFNPLIGEWVLRAYFYPPLLDPAAARKFMTGYVMLSMAQRDITAVAAAERPRPTSGIHYKQRGVR